MEEPQPDAHLQVRGGASTVVTARHRGSESNAKATRSRGHTSLITQGCVFLSDVSCGRFSSNVRYDDTDGYFVMGGGRYMQGIYGYFGPAVVYRLGTTRVGTAEHKDRLHAFQFIQPLITHLLKGHT